MGLENLFVASVSMDTIFDMTVNAINKDRGSRKLMMDREKICAVGSLLPTLWGSRVFHIIFFYCVAFFFIIGQTFAYMFQYAEIYQKRSAVGFSLLTCLALLISNHFRLLFWIGRTFSWIVPVSCLVMIFCMLVLMEIAIRMNRRRLSCSSRKSIWKGHLISHFWNWHDYSSFIVIFLMVLALPTLLSAFLLEYVPYVETLGYIPTVIEAGLGFPQLWLNYQRKSVSGMSVRMVLLRTAGSVTSTVSYFFLATPAEPSLLLQPEDVMKE
uniref:Uncharacterized protein n=1 Tax=Ditylenchus dipsaci TaxID=166011 RepID=A0A915EGD1_9BILA